MNLAGRSEVIARVRSLPLCTAWLPDGHLVIVSWRDGRLLLREPDGSVVTYAGLDGTSPHAIVTGQTTPTWMAITPPAP